MTKEELKAYMNAIMYIANADEILSDDELVFFYNVGEKNGLSKIEMDVIRGGLLDREDTFLSIVENISETDIKTSLLTDLILLSYIDGDYSERERVGIKEIANILCVGEKELVKIEKKVVIQNKKEGIKNGAGVLGGYIVNAGKEGARGGRKAIHAVAKGISSVNSRISECIATTRQLKEENKQLRDELEKSVVNESVKQKIILKLNAKIESIRNELELEKKRNHENEEIIRLLQIQIEDLVQTIEVAEQAKTA